MIAKNQSIVTLIFASRAEQKCSKYLRGDAGQNVPPGGNSRHTTCKAPQKVVAALLPLVL